MTTPAHLAELFTNNLIHTPDTHYQRQPPRYCRYHKECEFQKASRDKRVSSVNRCEWISTCNQKTWSRKEAQTKK